MGTGEIFGGKAARFQQRDRQRIAHRQRRRGAGGGGQTQRTGFLGDADVNVDISSLSQCRIGVAGQGDQGHALTLDERQQGQNFVGFAGIGQGHHHVLGSDHAHVAVAGFGGMDKKSRAAGAGQGCSDFAADVAGFAHAKNDNPALAVQHEIAGVDEAVVDAAFELFYRLGFNR